MDRLPAVIAALVALAAACDKKDADGAAAGGRSDTVTADPARQESIDGFCDASSPPGSGPKVVLPPLVGGATPAAAGGWRWVNLWATWCKPCMEEMARLRRFHDRQVAAGKPFDLLFVSVSAGDDGLRLAEPDGLAAWLQRLGLETAEVTIPVHLFVDPTGHRRCLRSGPIADRNLPLIERLLSGS
jgi:hypothetical protein